MEIGKYLTKSILHVYMINNKYIKYRDIRDDVDTTAWTHFEDTFDVVYDFVTSSGSPFQTTSEYANYDWINDVYGLGEIIEPLCKEIGNVISPGLVSNWDTTYGPCMVMRQIILKVVWMELGSLITKHKI